MILDELIKKALTYSDNIDQNDLRIDNIILGTSFYTMKDIDHVYSDMKFCLILLENGYGFSYYQGDLNFEIGSIVNKKITDVINDELPQPIKVALTDALYCLINIDNKNIKFLQGSLRDKAKQRARCLLDNIPAESKVLLIGAVSEIIETALEYKIEIQVTDLEKTKIDSTTHVPIVDGAHTLDKLKKSDYAIVTGMVFATDTIDKIMQIAKENKVKLIFFMETGANFGNELIRYGATKVLCEYFPFYDFYGNTKYSIYERVTINYLPFRKTHASNPVNKTKIFNYLRTINIF